ncbi:MAG: zf-HC2 domain-containing protein [Planctomycetes bacterium]|nr:zf-HC2 domain-containing protein [Planctomycetota bacterium]
MNDSLNCNEIRALLVLFVGDDLDAAENARVARHLAECGPCRAEQARWMENRARLATLRDATKFSGPSVWSDVRAELVREGRIGSPLVERAEPTRPAAWRRLSWVPLAAAAAVLVAVGLFALFDRSDTASPKLPGENIAEPTPRAEADLQPPPELRSAPELLPGSEVQLANSPLRKAGVGDQALIFSAESIDGQLSRSRHGSQNNPALNLAGDEQIR